MGQGKTTGAVLLGDDHSVSPRSVHACVVGIACGTATLIGGFWLLSWLSGSAASWSLSTITPTTNASVALIITALALLLSSSERVGAIGRRVAASCSVLVALLGALTLFEHFFGVDFGFDQLIAAEPRGALGVTSPNRMGPPASLSFTLLGTSLLLRFFGRQRLSSALAVIVCAFILVPAVGFLYGIAALHSQPTVTAIAWPTTLSLLLLGLALILRPDEGALLEMLLRRSDPGGFLLRRMFPVAILLPLVIGLLRLKAERLGFVSWAGGSAAVAIAMVLLFSLFLWRSARRVSRLAAAQSQAERSAHERASELRRLYDSGMLGVLHFDLDGPITDANDKFLEMVGYTREDLVAGRVDWARMTPPEFVPLDLRGIAELKAYGLDTPYEKEYIRKDGSRMPILIGAATYDEARQRGIAFVLDLSARKLADAALRESEERFRVMADGTPLIIWTTDGDGRIEFVNRAYCEFFGVTVDEVQKGGWQPLVHPDDTAGYVDVYSLCLRDRSPFHAEARVRRHDGEWRWLESWGEPRFSAAGEFLGMAGSSPDITDRRRVESALRESERRYRGIVETSEEGIATHEPDGTITYVNQRMADMLGYSPEEMIGRSSLDFVDDEEREGVIRAREGVKTQGSFSNERKMRRKDGSYLWTLSHVSSRRDETGNFVGYLAMHTEISARIAAEEEKSRISERFRLLSETAGSLLSSEDPQGLVESLCRAVLDHLDCQAFFNFLVDETAGRLRLNACAGIPEEEARAIEWLDYGVAVCGCVALEGRRIIAENIPNTADPRTALVASYGIQAYCCHPLTAQGRLIGTLSFGTKTRTWFADDEIEVMRTVADQVATAMQRVRTERALRESEERYRGVVQNTTAIILRVDPSGVIQYANPRALELFGYSDADLVGRHAVGTIVPERETSGRDLAEMVAEIGKDPERFHANANENMCKDGRRVWLEWTNSGIYDADGGLTGFLSVGIDATERRRAEEALREARDAAEAANRAKSDFLTRMSHEMRTPMNGIMGMTELALMEPELPQRARDFLALSKQASKGLLEIINDVLDIAKIEAGRAELVEKPFDLRRVVEDLVAPLRHAAERKGVRLQHRVGKDVPVSLMGDEGRLRQVLTNIVGNAVKFTERGEVEVGVALSSPGATSPAERMTFLFSIRDTGIGIPPENLSLLFDKFSGATRSTHAQYGGTGLGLSISKNLVEMMGGRLWAESEAGHGSLFQFTAEFSFPEAAHQATGAEPLERRAAERRLRVLVAEDNPLNQVFALELLRRLGHEPVSAADGEEALRVLSREPFDAVLMDVQMPKLDGDEATRRIRGGLVDGCPRDLPVIAVTAHAVQGDRERFLAAGMDDYLSKPFEPDALDDVLWRVTERRLGAWTLERERARRKPVG